MSKESVQFTELVRLQYGELERQEIVNNIADAELDGEITKEQAEELRKQYGAT